VRCKVFSRGVLKATLTDWQTGGKKMEHCQNPWEDNCNSENIKLYIVVNGATLPICKECWANIADKEIEW
jgi:hypothetical protein